MIIVWFGTRYVYLKIVWFCVFSDIIWFGIFSENSLVWCGQDADLLRLHPVGVRLHQRWSRRLPRAQSTLARSGRRPVARCRDSLTSLVWCGKVRVNSGFILSECACISAGLGAFPVLSQPSPGQVGDQ
jgi:hypothetical protein